MLIDSVIHNAALTIYADLNSKIETIDCELPHASSVARFEALWDERANLLRLHEAVVREFLPEYYEDEYPVAAA